MNEAILTIIVAVISTGIFNNILNIIITRSSNKKNSNDTLKSAAVAFMKSRIRELCEEYMERKYIYTEELEDLLDLHKSYHDLGGNGFLDQLMNNVKNLEIKK